VPGLNVGEPRRVCGQFGCAGLFRLPAGIVDASERLLGPFALGPEPGQCPRGELPAAALAFDGRGHYSRQVGLERRAGRQVSIGARIDRGERRFESRGSRNDHNWRRQTESANLLDERGAALRLHLDDDSCGVAVALQPFKGRGRCPGPRQCDILCNSVKDTRGHQSATALLCNVEDLHGGGLLRFAIYRSMVTRSAGTGTV